MTVLDELIQELCPDGVKYKALGEICKLVTGATPSKTNAAYWENGTIPWMSSGEVNLKRVAATEKKITQLGYEKNSTTIVPKHSVVIALAGQGKTRGKAAITEIELCTNQSLCSMICNENLDYKFLYYILDGKYEELRAISNGDGTRGGLSLKILAPYKIPVPPLPVQREIVRILDNFTWLTAELTAELTARKKQYAYYRDKLLTFGDARVGVTSDVIRRTLGEVCKISAGGDAPKGSMSKQKTEKYSVPIISNGIGENALYGYTDAPKVEEPAVTVAARGTIGYAEYRDYPFYPIIRLLTAIPKDSTVVNTKYLYYCLQGKQYSVPMGGIPQLTAPELKKVEIPIPSLDVQNRIVQVLDNFDAICTDLFSGLPAEIEARQKQYEYYRDKLLTFKEKTS